MASTIRPAAASGSGRRRASTGASPYWTHFTRFLRGIGRLGFVLAQGVHRCDVAVVYPTAPAQAGVPSEQAVATCRAIVEGLWARGIDCDVVDRQGLDEARIVDGTLRVAGEIYRTLVLPGLTATHAIAAQRACELHAAGGQVLAVEPLPSTSELGSDDPWLTGVRQLPRYADATAALTALAELPRDFRGPDGAVACHRQAGGREIYQVVGAPGSSSCWFRASGRIELWDVWSGKRRAWPHAVAEVGGTRVVLPAEGAPGGGWLVVFTPAQAARYRPLPAATPVQRVPLTGTWDFQLRPTLDNRWGDFRLPIEQRMLGAEIRRFRVAGGGREVDPGFGARFLRFSGDADGAVLAAARSAADLAHLASTPVDLSWRWGVPGDLGPQGWHGNKASIGDDMFALGERQEASWPGDHNACTYRDTGSCWLWTTVITTRQTMARLVAGGVQPERVLINGRAFAPGAVLALDPGPTAVLARYTSAGRAHLVLIDQDHPDPQRQDLSSCWQGHPGLLALDPRPLDAPPEHLEALAPPGLREIRGRIHGSCTARIGGQRAAVAYGRADAAGWRMVTITVRKPSPDPIAVELAVQGSPGYGGSAAFAGPLALACGPGRLAAGDWSELGRPRRLQRQRDLRPRSDRGDA